MDQDNKLPTSPYDLAGLWEKSTELDAPLEARMARDFMNMGACVVALLDNGPSDGIVCELVFNLWRAGYLLEYKTPEDAWNSLKWIKRIESAWMSKGLN